MRLTRFIGNASVGFGPGRRIRPPRAAARKGFCGLQGQLAEHVERHFGTLAHRLRGEPHRGVDGAEAVVVAPLHDLEEEAAIERARIGVEEFARRRGRRGCRGCACGRSPLRPGRASPTARRSRYPECRAAARRARASRSWCGKYRPWRSRYGARRRRHRSRGNRAVAVRGLAVALSGRRTVRSRLSSTRLWISPYGSTSSCTGSASKPNTDL